MRTRAVDIPVLPYDDDADKIVIDELSLEEPTLVASRTMVGIPIRVGNERTLDLDTTLRHPAESRFFIRAAFEVGASTDVIADSLAAGECSDANGHVDWVIGPTWLARDCNWIVIVNLSDPEVPPDRRIAAWRPLKER